jgi:hypothetical protein
VIKFVLSWELVLTSHRYKVSAKENSLRKRTISMRNAKRYSPPSKSSAKIKVIKVGCFLTHLYIRKLLHAETNFETRFQVMSPH